MLRPQLLSTDDEGGAAARNVVGIELIAEPPEMSRSNLDKAVPAIAGVPG